MGGESRYFVLVEGEYKGPFGQTELTEMLSLGVIKPETLCQPEGNRDQTFPLRETVARLVLPQDLDEDFSTQQANKARSTLIWIVATTFFIMLGWVLMSKFVGYAINYLQTPSGL